MDDLRAGISFQQDIRDCNILCLTETWLTISVLRMDRTAEASKTKVGGVCFMINKKWCDPRNISILLCCCSPHLEHLSIICHPFYLPQEFNRSLLLLFTFHHRQTLTWLCISFTMCSADTLTNILTAAFIIAEDFNKANLRQVMPNFYQHYPEEDRIHWIIATLRLRTPTKPTHYRLLANRTIPPFSLHRNINKSSFRNPRWRE